MFAVLTNHFANMSTRSFYKNYIRTYATLNSGIIPEIQISYFLYVHMYMHNYTHTVQVQPDMVTFRYWVIVLLVVIKEGCVVMLCRGQSDLSTYKETQYLVLNPDN